MHKICLRHLFFVMKLQLNLILLRFFGAFFFFGWGDGGGGGGMHQ